MESGAEHSTVPLSIFNHKLKNVYKLQLSTVSLYQYDKSPLKVSGECQAHVEMKNDYNLKGKKSMHVVQIELIKTFPQ